MGYRLTLSIAAAFISLVGTARQLTPEEALARVEFPQKSVMKTFSAASATTGATLRHTMCEGEKTTLYVFDRAGNGGFIVVSADDDSGPALLGYTDSGAFPTDSLPDNVRWWLQQYSHEIAAAINGSASPISTDVEYEYPQIASIAPIVKTFWDQTAPYNDQCPEISGTRCPTGCVATAMAQVMNVHQWPVTGIGSHSYTPYSVGKELTLDFSTITYQWDKMLDRYTTDSPQENIDAVATLMYSCGVSISMQYHPNSSGGNYTSASQAFVKYFDYDKGLRNLSRNNYGMAEWFDMIVAELHAGRPVLYSGRNDGGGHAFVCDGYDTDGYFHINWGWSGLSDGYFLLTALDPNDQGVGGSSAGYNIDQAILIGVQRPQADSYYIPVMEFISNFTTVASGYERNYSQVKFRDRRGIFSQSIGDVTAAMGVKFTDAAGNVSYAASSDKSYIPGQGFTTYTVMAAEFPSEGTYVVTPAVRDEKGKWWDCEVGMDCERALNLTVTADSLLFMPVNLPKIKTTDMELLSPIYPGKEFGLRATLKNVSETEFYDEVTPVLELDDAEKGQATPIAVELLPGGESTFEWVGNFPSSISPGTYTLYLVDSNGRDLSNGMTVEVAAAPTEATIYTVTLSSLDGETSTETSPVEMSYSDLAYDVKIDCTAGYFTGIVRGGVWPLNSKTGIMDVEGEYVGVPAGESKTVELRGDMSEYLQPDVVYYATAYCPAYGYIGNKLYFTSSTAGIEVIGEERGGMQISYEPSTESVSVVSSEAIEGVSVYSMSGMVVDRHDVSAISEYTFSVEGLSHGVYLVAVSNASGATNVSKIIK